MRGRAAASALIAALLVLDFALLFGLNMARPLDHDEHQFIAAAAVHAREGLQPYVDFPYFHAPYQLYLQALVFRFSDHLLLAARLFSVVAALATHALVFVAAWNAAGTTLPGLARAAFAAGGVLVLLFNPLAQHTSGRAWNHDLGAVTALAGLLLLVACVSTDQRAAWPRRARIAALLAGGLLLGLAVGTRLTFFPLAAGLGLAVLVASPRDRRLPSSTAFAAGFGLALVPMLSLLLRAPAGFVFGNFRYPAINTAYRQITGHERAMTAGGKLWFFFEVALGKPGTVLLALALIGLWWIGRRGRGGGDTALPERVGAPSVRFTALGLAGWALPFLLVGAIAPTPSWAHYYHAPVVFLVVAVLYGFAALLQRCRAGGGGVPEAARRPLAVFAAIVVVTVVFGLTGFREAGALRQPSTWITVRVHQIGVTIAERAGPAPVLTLAPLYPLEGGAKIYPELVTSPFVWRTAGLVDASTRRAVGIVSEQELVRLLASRPPAAVLVGHEPDVEAPFIAFARANGYVVEELAGGGALWVAPPSSRNGSAPVGPPLLLR